MKKIQIIKNKLGKEAMKLKNKLEKQKRNNKIKDIQHTIFKLH